MYKRQPRDVGEGDEIVSGCINLSGVLRVRTIRSFGESTVSRIIHLVESANEQKSRSESFISRFARVYTPIVVISAVMLAVVPPLFLGGMAVPAVVRYGYGFVQGADAAAKELGTNIDINYFYGGQFYGDANITSRMEGWYSNGTQVVFACGGGIYTSAVEAALKNNGYVIGVDVDQNYIGANGVADGTYAYNPFITSAMKGLSEAVNTALSDIEAGDWSEIAASNGNFGLEDGDYIGLPTADDSWNFETFTKDEYETVKEKIKSGEITVDNNSDDATKPTVSEFTTVNYIQ